MRERTARACLPPVFDITDGIVYITGGTELNDYDGEERVEPIGAST